MSDGITEMYREERDLKRTSKIDWDNLDKELCIWEDTVKFVVKDLKDRHTMGLQKYGKSLTYNTDEDMLQHLYEELLDAAMYIKTLINQRNKNDS